MSTADDPREHRTRDGARPRPIRPRTSSPQLDLTPADLAEIGHCRGDDHRRRYALQLCKLRACGGFLQIIGGYRFGSSIICRASWSCPVLFLDRPGRGQTEREQALRIRCYLGLRASMSRPQRASGLGCGQALSKDAAAPSCCPGGRAVRRAAHRPPAPGTLGRIVTSEVTRRRRPVRHGRRPFARRPSRGDRSPGRGPGGRRRSSLFRLKDYPKSATPAAIKGDIVRSSDRGAVGDGVISMTSSPGHPSAGPARPARRCR